MSYKHLSIGKKIAAVFAVIAVINAVFGLFLATELRDIRDRVLNFTDSTLPSVLSVDNCSMTSPMCAVPSLPC